MNVHELTLQNYSASSGCPSACQTTLYLGTAGSYGNEQINVVLGEGWQGLTVKAVFQPSGVAVVVPDGGGVISVPWEATQSVIAYPKGRIVFEGVTDGRVLISTDIPYAVGSHSDTEGSNSQPPTPSEWEQYVDKVKGDADRAEQAAKDAEASVQDVKDAGAQAVTDIGAAKDSALDAIAKAGEDVAGSITADVQAAKDAAAAAEQSAKDAAAELPKVQQAGQTALDDIATERENSLTALEDEGDKQQSAVAGAGASALEAIQQAGQTVTGQITQTGATQVGAVQSAGSTQVGLVNSAGQQQAENIAQAGSQQVQAVQAAGMAAVGTVNDARDDAVEEIETANAHAPQINSATGYWQTWDTETGQYVDTTTKAQGPQGNKGDTGDPGPQGETGATPQLTIGTVTTLEPGEDATANITGTAEAPVLNFGIPKGEPGEDGSAGLPTPTAADAGKALAVKPDGTGYQLAGPYAPLSAAIRPTASGNPASITDSVEWPLQGLKVCGKSTQQTTTGANLIDLPEFTSNAYYNVLNKSQYADIYEQLAALKPGTQYRIGCSNLKQLTKFEIGITYDGGSTLTIRNSNQTGEAKNTAISSVIIYLGSTAPGERTAYDIMLNEGSTALEYEPYNTASPSPEYPQPIVSAGDNGIVDITFHSSNKIPLLNSTSFSEKGLNVAYENGIVKIHGTCNAYAWINIYPYVMNNTAETYVGTPILGQVGAISCDSPFEAVSFRTGDSLTTIPKGSKSVPLTEAVKGIFIEIAEGNTIDFEGTFGIFDDYTNFQIATPNGLPGISVDSGGNYIDTKGRQSACDVKDYGTGKYTQMVGHIESYNGENITTPYMSTTGQLSIGAEVYYVLDEPVVTDISADELAAYRALHTYDGVTVVSTSEDVAGLEVRYVADAQKYIDNRLTAAESHIQEIAAAQLNAQTGG